MTWRTRIARWEQYADIGQYRLRSLRDALVAGGAFKILFWPDMPVWTVVALSPMALVVFFSVGWVYRHVGWLQEASNVSLTESMSIPAVVTAEMLLRLCRQTGTPTNGIRREISKELQDLLEAKR